MFTLVLGLHHVDLRLGVSVQVRLGHALVVAQSTQELPDTCNTRHVRYTQTCLIKLYQHGSDEPEFIYFFQLKKSYFMFVTAVVI